MGKLIRLELFNFKSYKGHNTLLFGDSHFTSIVGPNGSGKSNSMDAISFVLGIKSSHLRSTHLRDLVYRGRVLRTSKINADGTATEQVNGDTQANGDGATQPDPEDSQQPSQSQRHDPQSAWVMAVYEDDAGEEQKWKRSITSSGASEYRINNRVVNAKAYNDALEAENILIKARNFLVFQGDVEAIASQSPKDLTRLVEQISGSLEYKADYDRLKVEADKAAEDQGFKLNQRRAINSEIKQYQEQKREAENYARKAEERDEAIVTHVLWKLFHFQRVMEESGAEIAKHQEELQEYRRGVEKYEQRLEDARRDQSKVTREISKVERDIKAKERDIEDKENGLVPISEKISISQRNLDRYQNRIDEVTKERDSQQHSVDQLNKDINKVQKAQTKWEQERQAQAQSEGRQLSDADLQEYNRLRSQVQRQAAANQSNADNVSRQLKTDTETVNNLKGKLETSEAQVQKFNEELDQLKDRQASLKTQEKQARTEMEDKKKEYNNLTSERLRTAQQHTELDEKLQGVLNKLIEADNGRRQSEKEIRTRETVAAMKRVFPGIRGRLHELCKPKQKKYEVAVSTVLGRHFDSIIVDTTKAAQDCITYLKEQRVGSLTFIPLDTIQVKAVNPNLKGMHKKMRLAIDIIECDSVIERAVTYACGNAMICDDLATAKYLCYERHTDAKAVTLEGTVIHKGGLMTGGRGPSDRNARRWEDTEVENLRKVKDNLMAQLAALPKLGHRRGTEEESLQGEITGLEQRLRYLADEQKSLTRNIDSKRKERDFVNGQLRELKPKYSQTSKQLNNLQANLDQLNEAIGGVEDSVFASFCQRLGYSDIREYEKQQGSQQEEAMKRKLEFNMQRSKLSNQLVFEKQRLEQTQSRITQLQASAKRDEAMIAELESEKDTIEEEAATLSAELEQVNERLSALQEKNTEKAEKVAEQRREVQKRSKSVEGVLKRVEELTAEVQRNAAGRYALLRKSRIDEVKIPLKSDSAPLTALPLDELMGAEEDAMDIDGEDDTQRPVLGPGMNIEEYGIELDFDQLGDELQEDETPARDASLQEIISNLSSALDKMAPNMRAIERLSGVESRLKTTEKDFETARRAYKRAKDEFEDVKATRLDLFNKAFTHIADQIGAVYKDLTRSSAFPLGGQAYLDTEDAEEPYSAGLKYHAMPPLKRFRDMEHLSGGEKTIAALALLFAVHSYQPSPFFVLDEVDAALDNANVAKVAQYVREHAGPGMQFIVISLKAGFFQESETLVGILRDQAKNSSRALTLDLRKYPTAAPAAA